MTLTSSKQVRQSFLAYAKERGIKLKYRHGKLLPQNYQCTDTRLAFVYHVDCLERDGLISTKLAERVTL